MRPPRKWKSLEKQKKNAESSRPGKKKKLREAEERKKKLESGPVKAKDGAIIEFDNDHKKTLRDAGQNANATLDKDGNIVLITDADKRHRELTRDASKNVTAVLDSNGDIQLLSDD